MTACHPLRKTVVRTPAKPVELLNNKKYLNISVKTGKGKTKEDTGDNCTNDERKKK